ncbi:MAG: hypothetical protein KC777_09065 [Cyanobacteria bacterium HKST-UBA02]|nr:hypothetical protein [Cyanobacteria bacterium HKST-UBA02]
MCCSAWPVIFSKTITGTWEVLVDGTVHHVLWYQNRVNAGNDPRDRDFNLLVRLGVQGEDWQRLHRTYHDTDKILASVIEAEVAWRQAGKSPRSYLRASVTEADSAEHTGNCLIIPLSGTWNSIRLLDTSSTPDLLSDIDRAMIIPPVASPVPMAGAGTGRGFARAEVRIVKFDIYDVVLAEDARAIPGALSRVDSDRRPVINEAVFDTLSDWYRCPVALCCFNNEKSGEAKPLGFAFEPLFAENLVVYTLDAHDGRPPDSRTEVWVDHTIFVGSYLNRSEENCGRIIYKNDIPDDLAPFLLDRAMGTPVQGWRRNGDYLFPVAAVRKGEFEGIRTLPPFAPKELNSVTAPLVRTEKYAQLSKP